MSICLECERLKPELVKSLASEFVLAAEEDNQLL
jgi:hypothetical protein